MNKLIFILTLLFFAHLLYGQNPDSLGNGLYQYHIPWPANIPKNIYAITTDNAGRKWIGTEIGIICLNDTTWSQFYNVSNLSLTSNHVTCIKPHGNGVIVGTQNGFSIYDGMNWNRYSSSTNPIIDSMITCIHVSGNNIWLGTRKGITIFDGQTWQNLNTQNSQIAGNTIFSIEKTSNGAYWIATNNGFCRYFNQNFYTYPKTVLDTNLDITSASIVVDNEDSVWFSFQYSNMNNFLFNTFYKIKDTTLSDLFSIYWGNNHLKNAKPFLIKNPNGGIVLSTTDGKFFLLNKNINEYDFHLNVSSFATNFNEIWIINYYPYTLIKAKLDENNLTNPLNYLDTNNLKVGVSATGNIFADEDLQILSEIPKNSGLTTILSSNLWIAGKDENDLLHITARLNNIAGNDWFCGPMMDSLIYQQEAEKWNNSWKVSKKEIDYHKNHWSIFTYKVPPSIMNWPGNGDTLKGQAYFLAPYFDSNSNHKYDPQNGDYPIIRGDQAVFFITNDLNNHDTAFGRKIGAEIHGMIYEFSNNTNLNLNNTLFVSYRIINRSLHKFDSLYLGIFNSFGIGYIFDDFVGCDSNLNLSFAYNANNFDGISTQNGFGENPPVIGSLNLNLPMKGFMKIEKSPNNPWNWPQTDTGFFYYMQSRWLDGRHLQYGGNGYPGMNATSDTVCNYMFHADWTEGSVNNPAWCRYGLQSTGPLQLDKDSSICFDIAYVYARDTSIAASKSLLKQRSIQIQNFYNQNLAFDCSDLATSLEKMETQINPDFEIFPNPAKDVLNIKSKDDLIFSVEILDVSGKILMKNYPKNSSHSLEIRSLSPGIYFLKMSTKDKVVLRKFVKN